ncbi:hypothetical protein EBR21_08065 [bacterium]|nr:hypothetical protein [bacterium]
MPNGRIAVAGRVSDAEAGFGIRTQSQNAGWVALLEVNGDSSLSKRIANGAVVSMSAVDKNKSGFAVLGYSEEISGAGVVHKPWLVGMNMDGALTIRCIQIQSASLTMDICLSEPGTTSLSMHIRKMMVGFALLVDRVMFAGHAKSFPQIQTV